MYCHFISKIKDYLIKFIFVNVLVIFINKKKLNMDWIGLDQEKAKFVLLLA